MDVWRKLCSRERMNGTGGIFKQTNRRGGSNMQTRIRFIVLMIGLGFATVAAGGEQWRMDRAGRWSELERWAEHLVNELNHLEEDIDYEREGDLRVLEAQVEEALAAAVHFRHVLSRGGDREHLSRDFRRLDHTVHKLLERLSSHRSSWLRRAASRIQYADQQLHYLLAPRDTSGGEDFRELVARHAHVLEVESRQLEQAAQRERNRRRLEGGLERVIRSFADSAEHFHQAVERGADSDHMRNDFAELDRDWQRVVSQINDSPYGVYLRLNAHRVNAVHNQLHEIVMGSGHRDRGRPEAAGVQPVEPDRDRRDPPRIQLNIPGVGRFQF
jgi:hypothetical protein